MEEQKSKKNIRDLQVGDVIIDDEGYEHKVLERFSNTVLLSCSNQFKKADALYTFDELEEYNFLFKEEDPEKKATRMQEIEDELRALVDDDKPWDGFIFHYILGYDLCFDQIINTISTTTFQPGAIYFKTEKSLEEAIKKVGEKRVLEYLKYKTGNRK